MSELKQCREAFEHWFSDEGESPREIIRSGDSYRLAAACSAWNAWQACWATRTKPEATALAQDLSGDTRAGKIVDYIYDRCGFVHRDMLVADVARMLAAIASPADALVAGDSETAKDAERYRYIRDTATLDNAVWEALEGYGMTNGAGELLEDEYRAGMDRAIDRAIQAQKDGHG